MEFYESFWEEMVNLGPRFAGTPQENKAVILIEKYINKLGFKPSYHEFTYQGWNLVEPVHLEYKKPISGKISSYCFIWSPSTPDRGVEGKLEYLGKHEIWGQYEWELFAIKDENNNYCSYVSGQKDLDAIPQALFEGFSSLPHFTIGTKDTKKIKSYLNEDKEVILSGKIKTETFDNQMGKNIIVKIPNKLDTFHHQRKSERLLITAHYDTLYNTPGAFDNASGVALLIALLEWLSINPLDIPIDLMFTDAEEFNLAGSKAYCNDLKAKNQLSEIKVMVNLDGIGRGDTLEIWSGPEAFAIKIWPYLNFEDLGYKKLLKYPPPPGSDHAPFYNDGLPVVMFSINDIPILHRPEDVIDEEKRINIHKCFKLLKRFLPDLVNSL